MESIISANFFWLIFAMAVPRLASDDGDAGSEGHAANRKRVWRLMRSDCLPWAEAAHQQAGAGTGSSYACCGLAIERPKPGLVRRHHLRPDRVRLPLFRGDHGLGEPGGAGVAAIEHDECVALS